MTAGRSRIGCGAATAIEDREEACSGVESAEAGCVDTEVTSEGARQCCRRSVGFFARAGAQR
jgi:hypothetical protein